ncbi:MAG: flagellar hook-basal body complex protein FliE [Microvirga sp.]|nr:flagellar hook-basal body complex protein FliE [Microvirga sp.]
MATNAFAAGAYAAVQGLGPSAGQAGRLARPQESGLPDFSAMLGSAIGGVRESGRAAEAQAASVAMGKADVVDVVTAVAESEAAIETLVAVRDRVIQAYEEIMRMPI